MHSQLGWPQLWFDHQENIIPELVRASQRLRLVSSHQASSSKNIFIKGTTTVAFLISSQPWTRGNISNILPGLGEQELSFCYEGGSQIKVIFASHFEMKIISLDDEWKDTNLKMLEVQCAVSAASNDSEWHAICFCKVVSKVNKSVYQEIMECFKLACVDKLYGGADFLFPKHMSTVPKLLLNGLMTILLLWVRNIWKPHLSI